MEWAKVIELLAVNRLVAPESELGVHQRWYATSAMDVVLGTDDAMAAKDRLYRALDKALEHKKALECHLVQRWRDLFGAKCNLLLYDLTSTYYEGQAGEIPAARRGYSRDSRPDALQLIWPWWSPRRDCRFPTKSLRVTVRTSPRWRKFMDEAWPFFMTQSVPPFNPYASP